MSHSLSPPMHNAALKYCNLEGSYELLDIAPAELEQQIERIKTEGYTGFNVTIPHKDAIYRMAGGHTKEAAQAQASNTVKILEEEFLLAHNTDIGGFEEALSELITKVESGAAACVIGTGGAAKAAILALRNLGYKSVSILSRDPSRAESMAREIEPVLDGRLKLIATTAHACSTENLSLIVNSTPMGQNNVPVPDWMNGFLTSVSPQTLVFDMVYSKTKEDTAVVALAKKAGLKASDGAEMLIRQAHKAFQFWTELSPPVEVFRSAFKQSLKHQM
ncbi:MAG: shikimate dehydrogenase [Candidatus Melainabacteria bacterium]|nr:MAG: shikimate dehydrogenase [Candidatus Melainabacteria bacterium]